jgi:hypothetical protein
MDKKEIRALGQALAAYRDQRDYEPEEYPPYVIDGLVLDLGYRLGISEELNRAYKEET